MALDGDTYVIHEAGYWVKFEIKRVRISPEWPYGIKYSLTLHSPDNERLVGFDNAHPVRKIKAPRDRIVVANDHRHKYGTVRPYPYQNALKLIDDFWEAVDTVLKERTRT